MDSRDPLECPCEFVLPRLDPLGILFVLVLLFIITLVVWGLVLLVRSLAIVGFDPQLVDWRGTGSMISGLTALTGGSGIGAVLIKRAWDLVNSRVQEQEPLGAFGDVLPLAEEGETK
jgi:hypothetical protein